MSLVIGKSFNWLLHALELREFSTDSRFITKSRIKTVALLKAIGFESRAFATAS